MSRRHLPLVLIAAAWIASALAWPELPDRVPLHWNVRGEVDGWGGRLEGTLLLPAVMVVLYGVFRLVPKIDPRGANFARMADTWELVIALVLALMLVIHLGALAAGLGHQVPMGRIMPVAVGLVFIGLGNVLPRAKPNWVFGIRTPWTLSNDRVWARTHRLGGYTMVAGGVLMLGAAAAPARWTFPLLAVGIGIAALIPTVYSYFAWRREASSR